MLNKAKRAVDSLKEDMHRKKLEKAYSKKERELEEERLEAERIAREQEELLEEKERLCSLSEKELMVELIYAVRGFYNEFIEIKERNIELAESISDLEDDIEYLRSELNSSND